MLPSEYAERYNKPFLFKQNSKMNTRSKSLFILAVILVSGVFFCGKVSASEPNGSAPQNAEEAFERSDAVLTGKVIEVEKDKLGFSSLATVQVDKSWKGKDLPLKIRIDGSGGPTYPARLFNARQSYLFYLNHTNQSVWRADSFLNRVLPIEQASDDLKFLSQKPSSKP